MLKLGALVWLLVLSSLAQYHVPVCYTTIVDGVLEAARGLELLGEGDQLKMLDSLDVLDMVVEIERVVGIKIPTPEIRMEHFESVETVCAWLARLGR